MAFLGHLLRHAPHPVHFSEGIWRMVWFMVIVLLIEKGKDKGEGQLTFLRFQMEITPYGRENFTTRRNFLLRGG